MNPLSRFLLVRRMKKNIAMLEAQVAYFKKTQDRAKRAETKAQRALYRAQEQLHHVSGIDMLTASQRAAGEEEPIGIYNLVFGKR